MSRAFTRRATAAALTVLAITALSTTAHAESRPDASPAGDLTVAYTTAACDPSGTTSRDASLATQLNGTLTAKLEGAMTAYRVSCARMVVDAVRDRGLDPRAADIAIATTIVETSIQNVSEEVDHDSLGLFQQRASWGSATNRLNPTWATNAFLDKMISKYPNNSWKTAPIGEVCQAVQVSAFPDRYQVEAGDAQKIVDALWQARATDGADFDADGVGDIFSSATGTLTVWNGRGANNFAAADAVGPGWSAFSRPVAGDFDDDGISDLAAVEGGSTLTIWNGRGGNRFSAAVAVGPGWGDYDSTLFALGDVNGDGHADIGSVKEGTGTLYVWNGRGNNKFAAAVAVGNGWGAYSRPVSGDFDGDGISDLAAVEGGSTLTIWNGRGSNNFAAGVAVGPGWGDYDSALMSLGDVNGDGHDDIASVKEGTGTLYVWNGRGADNFGGSTAVGNGWTPYF
ncbi:FG-GAP repeat domain-containing protein [Actinophytocola oryzae]|uniref:VCBS repeat protein n=1 Tax=Actinophytocola oryzae TaxID=502181 RepID=A0A4R7VIB0_9PSEU|nr:VCBS repeat-containing protein [Actinophytocola oryzae]TDV48839.1 VCBS repeat protein [Actinophytocola oryzae]